MEKVQKVYFGDEFQWHKIGQGGVHFSKKQLTFRCKRSKRILLARLLTAPQKWLLRRLSRTQYNKSNIRREETDIQLVTDNYVAPKLKSFM